MYDILNLDLSNTIALDTETTGIDLHHSCQPFCISTCDTEGNVKYWEWGVNPYTRISNIPIKTAFEVTKYLAGKNIVFHNSKFDIKALETVGITFNFEKNNLHTFSHNKVNTTVHCNSFYDTYPLSHIFQSSGSHGLKDLAKNILDYGNEDEEDLKEQVAIASRFATKYFPDWEKGYDLKGKRVTEMDYWLPQAIYKSFNLQDAIDEVHLKHKPHTKAAQNKVQKLTEEYDLFSKNLNKEYACKDVERTILLFMQYLDWLREDYNDGDDRRLKVYEREMKLIPILYHMQSKGITIKNSYLNKALTKVSTRSEKLIQKCNAIGEITLKKKFNSKSGKDLTELLFDDAGFNLVPTKLTPNGNPSTNKKSLEDLYGNEEVTSEQRRFMRTLLEAKMNASATGYLQGYKDHKVLYSSEYSILRPSLNPNGTQTTRFSSSNPNGQNVSKITTKEIGNREYRIPSLRSVFSPLPGKRWYAIDYSQLELRVFAVASQEKSLIEALNNGYDFHEYVACRIFDKPAKLITKEERRIAKNTNFAIIFGATPKRVNETAGMDNAYDLFADQFPNVHEYMKKIKKEAKENGYVTTLYGYPLDVAQDKTYRGVNYIVQGTAGDIVKNAMIGLDQYINRIDTHMLLQIHDELIFETPDEDNTEWLHNVVSVMEGAGKELGIITPVSVDLITDNWAESQEIELGELAA